MACQIEIESIQAEPPYFAGSQPNGASVIARASDCARVVVTVSVAGPGSQPVAMGEVGVDFSNAVMVGDATLGLVTFPFTVPAVGLQCGDPLHVSVVCEADRGCAAEGLFPIKCKGIVPGTGTTPGGGLPGGEPGSEPGGGQGWPTGEWPTGWPPGPGWWPPNRCAAAALLAADTLLAALVLLAAGVGWQRPGFVTIATAGLVAAGIAWALWLLWCAPSSCTKPAVACWVFKRAFIGTLAVLVFSTSAGVVFFAIGYGAVAGCLVNALRAQGCLVPSARLPLTQIPI
jgi:hypothetical protein